MRKLPQLQTRRHAIHSRAGRKTGRRSASRTLTNIVKSSQRPRLAQINIFATPAAAARSASPCWSWPPTRTARSQPGDLVYRPRSLHPAWSACPMPTTTAYEYLGSSPADAPQSRVLQAAARHVWRGVGHVQGRDQSGAPCSAVPAGVLHASLPRTLRVCGRSLRAELFAQTLRAEDPWRASGAPHVRSGWQETSHCLHQPYLGATRAPDASTPA